MKRTLRIVVIAVIGLFAIRFWQDRFTERGRARCALHKLGDAIIDYREANARWPADLNEVNHPELLEHEGTVFTYDPAKQVIRLPKTFELPLLEQSMKGWYSEGNFGMDLNAVWVHRHR